MQTVGVAAHAAVPQHQPLRDPGRSRPRRRGTARSRGRRSRSRHLPACAQHNHTGKRLTDSPGRCNTTASHHPGPGGKRSALTGSEVRRRHARGTSALRPEGPSSEDAGGGGEARANETGRGHEADKWSMRGRARACHAPRVWPALRPQRPSFFLRAQGVAAARAPPHTWVPAWGKWVSRVFPLGSVTGQLCLSEMPRGPLLLFQLRPNGS